MIDIATVRRLAIAAALSGTAHAALVAVARIEVPRTPEALPPLAARIVTPPSPPRSVAQPQQRRSASRAITHAREHLVEPAAPRLQAVESGATVIEVEAPAGGDTAEPIASSDEPVVVATAPASLPERDEPPVRRLPRTGRITYDLVYGGDRFPVGRTIQTWQTNGTRYHLASRSETTGIVDLIRSQHRTFMSRGSMTRTGLRPETFLMSRNRGRGTEEARARFDWDGSSVTLESAAASRNESLPPRTQDLLSLMYQLSLDPPAVGRFRQTVTNGSRIETYELEALPEQTIETQLGSLRTLPVKQVRTSGAESLELWLGIEYHYLPVRLRFFSREGEPQGEQIVTEIRVSEN